MDKQHGAVELRKVRRSQLCRLARRMQRIRQQQKPGNQLGLIGSQHGSLPAAVRMAAQIDAFKPWMSLFQNRNRPSQSLTIVGCATGRWRTMRTLLAKGQVAT